jgi:hypothetical protein
MPRSSSISSTRRRLSKKRKYNHASGRAYEAGDEAVRRLFVDFLRRIESPPVMENEHAGAAENRRVAALQRDWRDRRRRLAPPGVGRRVGQFEELPPRMAPVQRLDDRAGLAVGKIQAAVTVEGVGLQNAGVTGHMPLGMLASRANDSADNDDRDGPPHRRSRDRLDDLANRRRFAMYQAACVVDAASGGKGRRSEKRLGGLHRHASARRAIPGYSSKQRPSEISRLAR